MVDDETTLSHRWEGEVVCFEGDKGGWKASDCFFFFVVVVVVAVVGMGRLLGAWEH